MNCNGGYFFIEPYKALPIVKPNRITGEGRARPRPFSAYKVKDKKKKQHRKMAKESRRKNNRG